MLVARFNEALDDFHSALSKLRDHALIDYKQLGMTYKLAKCEILHNMYEHSSKRAMA